MKKRLIVPAAILMALTMTTTVLASGWKAGLAPNQNRWWYDDEDGTFAESEWRWLDGNQDGTAECYAFDREGWMYADTTTPDGYQVNRDGAWVVNGVVQTRNAEIQTQEAQATGDSRILVVYYSLPETDGTDTDSGASRVAVNGQVQGNMEYMANTISQSTSGDLFRNNTAEAYPGLHAPLVDQASKEFAENARPALSTHIDNLDNYDVIFVGYPIWWGEMPMPMYSFFEEYDFSGKTVIPFSSHGGSGFSGTINVIAGLEPGANVRRDGYTVSRDNVARDAGNLRTWVEGLNLLN
ncbi:flavodoxin [Lacrimispora sp.]|uniref:flavodoxin n=1 Tax=Lacrimispora sp. TaxID=2719234 RepID=UPI00345F9E2C